MKIVNKQSLFDTHPLPSPPHPRLKHKTFF